VVEIMEMDIEEAINIAFGDNKTTNLREIIQWVIWKNDIELWFKEYYKIMGIRV
jgi:hypothetical protein